MHWIVYILVLSFYMIGLEYKFMIDIKCICTENALNCVHIGLVTLVDEQ